MELKDYARILSRRIWLLVLITLLGVVGGYVASRVEKPVYQASTKILVSKDLSDQHSQFAAMNNQQLIDAYVQLLRSTSVVDEASRRLNFEIDLKDSGSVQQVQSTNVIQITFDDGDPQRAATIANTLVQVLIDHDSRVSGYASTEEDIKKHIAQIEGQISTLQSQYNSVSEANLQDQLGQINGQITTLQDQISKLGTEIGALNPAYLDAQQRSQLEQKQAQLAELQSLLAQYQQARINLEYFGRPILSSSNSGADVRLQVLQSTLDKYQQIYANLLENLQTVQLEQSRHTPAIEQIERAVPPSTPLHPQPLISTILAGMVGLVLAIGVAFVLEYSEKTRKRSNGELLPGQATPPATSDPDHKVGSVLGAGQPPQ